MFQGSTTWPLAENSRTANMEPIETIPKTEPSGVVGRVMPLATPGRSLRLSADERAWLHRIQRDRERGFMVSGVDVDFVLEVLRRLGA